MDKTYWESYYSTDQTPKEPSSFAIFCMGRFIQAGSTLVELGSGNFRDSLFLARQGVTVHAIEQSIVLNAMHEHAEKAGVNILESDFTTHDFTTFGHIAAIYSRFTLHAVKKDEETATLVNAFAALPPGGVFCIEARTTQDPLFGQGKKIDQYTYFTTHARRFIESQLFIHECQEIGFRIRYFTEEAGLSKFGDDDPVLMRVVLEKPA